MNIIKKQWVDSGTIEGVFSLATQEVLVKDDGIEVKIGELHREIITPTCEKCECVVEINPQLLEVLQLVWQRCGNDCCRCVNQAMNEKAIGYL